MSTVDIAGREEKSATTTIDTSNFITYQSGNDLYVNEQGDKMRGILNMINNKIINVAEPTSTKDATTKSYVDNKIRVTAEYHSNAIKDSIKNMFKDFNKTITDRIASESKNKIEKNRLPDDIVDTKALDNAIKEQQLSINDQFLDNKGLIRSDKLPSIETKQHFYNLNIGKSDSSVKLTVLKIPLTYDRTTNFDGSPKYPKLSRQMIHFQITPFLNNNVYNDEISMSIQHYEVQYDGLDVYIISSRASNTTGWGLNLHAYLTLTINFNGITELN